MVYINSGLPPAPLRLDLVLYCSHRRWYRFDRVDAHVNRLYCRLKPNAAACYDGTATFVKTKRRAEPGADFCFPLLYLPPRPVEPCERTRNKQRITTNYQRPTTKQREEGNVMMDSPRFHAGLANALDSKGGVALMVMSHIDDVGDHQRRASLH